MTLRLVLVGWGAIGTEVARLLSARAAPVTLAGVAVRDASTLRAGLADVHAVTLSMGQLVASATISVDDARWALVLGFATNMVTKMVRARRAGSAYFNRLWPGHLAVLIAVCATAALM